MGMLHNFTSVLLIFKKTILIFFYVPMYFILPLFTFCPAFRFSFYLHSFWDWGKDNSLFIFIWILYILYKVPLVPPLVLAKMKIKQNGEFSIFFQSRFSADLTNSSHSVFICRFFFLDIFPLIHFLLIIRNRNSLFW